MSRLYEIFEEEPGSSPAPESAQRPPRGWRNFFRRLVAEPVSETAMPHYDALNPKQQKALVQIERQAAKRFTALAKNSPIKPDKTINYKYKGDKPILHELGFMLPDTRYEFATVSSETDWYQGVRVSTGEQKMVAALIELYLAKNYHVRATHITLNDPMTVSLRDRFDDDGGKFWHVDICKDAVPPAMPNLFSNVEMQTFAR